ncbi:hypothetical protein CEXT_404911 [Caerostris extrusa]|uniref:Uncharacterized protein n=1 Tax=Caerostris extrusa TaxID=172846 RepID=A0AAV4NWI5_CAEEX|nr:hypothetical protein CEXT_404911 [Caerostris extrusa]
MENYALVCRRFPGARHLNNNARTVKANFKIVCTSACEGRSAKRVSVTADICRDAVIHWALLPGTRLPAFSRGWLNFDYPTTPTTQRLPKDA